MFSLKKNDEKNFQLFNSLQTQFLWFASFSFHLALFFLFLKFPEVRSFLKFQFLLFSKFSRAFFTFLFSVSNFFSLSKKKGKETTTKFLFLCSSFEKRNSFSFSNTNFSSVDFQKMESFSFFLPFSLFFLKKWKKQQNFFNDSLKIQKESIQKFRKIQQRFFISEMEKNIFFETVFRLSNFSFLESSEKFKKVQNTRSSLSFFSNSLWFNQSRSQNSFPIETFLPELNISKISHSQSNFHFSEFLLSQMSLSLLFQGKNLMTLSSKIRQISSFVFSKVFEFFEFLFVSLYKFLEKPAELIIEWIALIFLLEWSSDILTYLPETFEISFSFTTKKFSRSLRFANLFGNSSNFQNWQSFPVFNTSSFLFQKQLLLFFEQFFSILTQPDIDILIRQRKGVIFWDIWADILLKTAEKYNVNVSSFVTLKEEQELFIEKLLQDKQFLENIKTTDTKSLNLQKQKNFELFKSPLKNMNQTTSLLSKILKISFESSLSFNSNLFSFSREKRKFRVEQDNFFFKNFQDRWSRYSVQQYVTFQGSQNDFFVDIHPPLSFQHIPFLKYVDSAQFMFGSLVCEIYGGLFSKQISKNILVLGSQGAFKTLFVQALAGETEMKIITENASRYAFIQNGVAVGMKYLRDVFDALAFQTPCFFLIENIHLLGSKRPLLISDDENIKVLQPNFGMDQQEIHETNQMIFQLMRHSISDYRRPFKGDFSMGISTNSFVQNLSSFSEKPFASMFTNSQFSEGGFLQISPLSPLPMQQIESTLVDSLFSQGTSEKNENWFQKFFSNPKKQSFLQFSKEEVFAPPATSPFLISRMKEQKKLQPRKIVSDNSWGGFSTDQLLSFQKETSFVRSKVAMLADITLTCSRQKFDMITDLLVILDNVRSNRGFVVFATTHLPSLLDPALRRPGRFDETLSLDQTSTFLSRFEIFKISFQSSISTFDCFDASFLNENTSSIKGEEKNLLNLLQAAKFSLFHTLNYTPKFSSISGKEKKKSFSSTNSTKVESKEGEKKGMFQHFSGTKNQRQIFAYFSPKTSFQNLSKTSTLANFYTAKKDFSWKIQKKTSCSFLRNEKLFSFFLLPKGPSHELTLAYTKIGIFLVQTNLSKSPMAFFPLFLEKMNSQADKKQKKMLQTTASFSSLQNSKYLLQVFLAGKVSEFFLFSHSKFGEKWLPSKSVETNFSVFSTNSTKVESKNIEQNFDIFEEKFCEKSNFSNLTKAPFPPSLGWSSFGGDSTWQNAMPFLFLVLQKRFLFTKNSLLFKMLFFENKNQQKQPPSPPFSSLSIPAKKYEQFKRAEHAFTSKGHFSMNQKIQMHQQQKFLKQLYNIPQQNVLFSQKFSSIQELAYFDSVSLRGTSSHFYYKQYFVQRHRFSYLNQWWNGFFPEHTPESTFLSDVDWRTMFGTSLQPEKSISPSKEKKFLNFEFSMDFPDAEQYYNPRNRRWYFEKNFCEKKIDSSKWFKLDLHLQYEIYYHSFFQVFYETFLYFDKNRELLDFFVSQLLQKGSLKELDSLTILTRFLHNLKFY